MTRFKAEPAQNIAPTEHKSVEDFIASAPVRTVTKPLREWEKYNPDVRPIGEDGVFFQMKMNRYQYWLLKAVAKHNSRSMRKEILHTLLSHLEECKKELP